MKENSLAKRYAGALVKTLTDDGEYRLIKSELEGFQHLLSINADFKAGMETLLFSKPQKKEMLDSLYKEMKLQQKTLNFLLALVEENRIPILDLMIEQIEDLWFEKNGIEKVKVFSAIEISSGLEEKLIKKLEESFNKKIVIAKVIDPALIGGIKIQRGLIFYDFSMEGNLQKLKEALLADLDLPRREL